MNLKEIFKPLLPHILVIVAFVALSFAYFSPLLEGKDLPQMDNTHAKGVSKELNDFEKANPGQESLWTNSLFSGMPSYQIKGGKVFNIFHFLQRVFRLEVLPYTTVSILFIYLLGFYVLLISLKLDIWLSFAGALGFAFASFNFIVIGAGHLLQAYAIAYMAPVVAGVLLIYNKKYWQGAIITILGLGLEVSYNHPQIVYYLFFIVLVIVAVKFIYSILEKQLKGFFIASAILAGSALLAVLPNISNLWTTSEYSKYSIRGASELTAKSEKKESGLDRDYALAWSYGVPETFTVLIPNFQGGGSGGFDEKSETVKTLRNIGVQGAERIAQSLPAYWGDQPFTSGPVYFGAIICFLFIFSLFIVKGPEKWWLLAATILSIVLAWGKNFPLITDLFFYHFPMYNKFRTVSMILVIANITVPLLGFLGLKEMYEGKVNKDQGLKALKYSIGIVGGLILLFALVPGMFFSFSSSSDSTIVEQLKASKWPQDIINQLLGAMQSDRESMLRSDAFRSLFFVLVAGCLIWAYNAKKLKNVWFASLLAFFILIDMWQIDKRYINDKEFVSKKQAENPFVLSAADEFIKKDVDPDYRVLNLSQNVFNDAYTSYFHKSIGGYHGAKLRRYQDLIDRYLGSNVRALQQLIYAGTSADSIRLYLRSMPVINMLNTKFIIYNPEAMPIINFNALGNAWFVRDYNLVGNADEEISALGNFDPSGTAIIDKRFEPSISGLPQHGDSVQGSITLKQYKPNDLVYESKSPKNQLAVFSEIYYEKGWIAYIDNKPSPILRANYVLRSLMIPAGQHKIEFKFDPESFKTGKRVAYASSIAVILVVCGAFGKWVYSLKKKEK
jgi:hypothetical protein